MKERGFTIVDSAGATVFDLQGDDIGAKSANGYYFHDVMQLVTPLLVGSLNSFLWTCRTGIWQLAFATAACTVTGATDAAAQLVHCAASVALASGTDQLSAVLDLEATAPFIVNGVLIAAPTEFFPGDSLGLVLSGDQTGLVGCLTIGMKRIG